MLQRRNNKGTTGRRTGLEQRQRLTATQEGRSARRRFAPAHMGDSEKVAHRRALTKPLRRSMLSKKLRPLFAPGQKKPCAQSATLRQHSVSVSAPEMRLAGPRRLVRSICQPYAPEPLHPLGWGATRPARPRTRSRTSRVRGRAAAFPFWALAGPKVKKPRPPGKPSREREPHGA